MHSAELAPAQATYEFTDVDPDNPRCVEQIMELTQALAWRRFGGQHDAEELVQDAVSLAWEFSQRGKGTPFTVAKFAIRRTASGGQFSRSVRSVDHRQPHPSRRRREGFHEEKFDADTPDPSDTAATQIDFEEWQQTLTERQREVLSHLEQGYNTREVGRILGCTGANISEMRRFLAAKYECFCAK